MGNDIINNTYQIIGAINKGGIGTIYKAIHLRLNKYVILKRIDNDFAKKMDKRVEVDILKSLSHEYLPQVYDFIEQDGQIFTVIDYIEGKPLSFYIKNKYKLSQKQVIIWAKQLCEALVYLNSQNPPILHRDIKPDNIMIRNNGTVCLIDFNISMGNDESSKFISGLSVGYSSPEQFYFSLRDSNAYSMKMSDYVLNELRHSTILEKAVNSNKLNLNSDIYSLGATLYHAMFGIKPTLSIDSPLQFPKTHYEYSEVFLDVIKKSVEVNPDYRYKSAEEMLNSLENLHKTDFRYKKYKQDKFISLILCIVMMISGCLLAYAGTNQLKKEKDDRYNNIIYTAQNYVDNQDYDKSVSEYENAINLCEDKIAAYFGKLNSIYKSNDYDKAINYGTYILNANMVQNSLNVNKEKHGEIYYIIGDSFFNKEDYNNSAENFKKATETVIDNSIYYRDYAIALARLKQIDLAQQILEKAREYNISIDSSLLVEAEIALAKGENQKSIEYFNGVINSTQNNDIKKRACILCSQAYKISGEANNEILVLEKAVAELPPEYTTETIMYLGDAYSRRAKLEPEESNKWYSKALYAYKSIYDIGKASFNVQLNLASLYEYLGDFSNSENILLKLSQDFPKEYKVYARLSMLYIDIESNKSEKDKNYNKSLELYNIAKEKYKQAKNNGASDGEMQTLENMISKLKQQGWIK